MPSSEWVLYDLNLDRIGNDCAEISRLSRSLARGPHCRENWRDCDLERSARGLRDAADKLDAIRDRLGMPELEFIAAECSTAWSRMR